MKVWRAKPFQELGHGLARSKQISTWHRALGAFLRDGGPDLAAAVAFYTLFSLFPCILLVLIGLSLVLGSGDSSEGLFRFTRQYLPVSSGLLDDVVRGVLANRGPITGLSVLGLLWGATGMFGALNRSINRLWHTEKRGPIYRAKLTEMALLLGFLATFFASVLLTGFIHATFGPRLSESNHVLNPLRIAGSILPVVLSVGALAVLYKIAPTTLVPWRLALLGSALATVLVEGAKHLFFWYVRQIAGFNAVYGPLSSVMLLLVWVYLSSVLVLFGAELTRQYVQGKERSEEQG